MQTWEYLFVFAAITSDGGEFRPRFANDQELDEWQKGPTLYEYSNQLGESGWELLASNPDCIGTACHRNGFQTTEKRRR